MIGCLALEPEECHISPQRLSDQACGRRSCGQKKRPVNTDYLGFATSATHCHHQLEWSYLGRAQTASAYSGRSLSIAVKAHLPGAGIVHTAQGTKRLCIVLYHNVNTQDTNFGCRRSGKLIIKTKHPDIRRHCRCHCHRRRR